MGQKSSCSSKDDIINRLKRIEGQIRGIIRMVEEEKGCVDILTQVTAAKAALNKAGSVIIKKYCKDCINVAAAQESNKAMDDLIEIIEKSYDF